MKTVRLLGLMMLVVSSSTAFVPMQMGQCKDTLAHLAPKLPVINNRDIANLRNAILATNVQQGVADLQRRAVGAASVAELVAAQKKELDDQMTKMVMCVTDIWEGDRDQTRRAFASRAYDARITIYQAGDLPPLFSSLRQEAEVPAGSDADGEHNKCIRQFIEDDMVEIASAELAVQVACRGGR